jgi:hypothetical protein
MNRVLLTLYNGCYSIVVSTICQKVGHRTFLIIKAEAATAGLGIVPPPGLRKGALEKTFREKSHNIEILQTGLAL